MDKEVSIIIVNYNTENLLKNCIDSIYENTVNVDFEIIIVDNNSIQPLNSLKESYPEVNFHILKENIGFGRANNVGAQIATGKYLFFLNPDTLLLNNAIYVLLAYMQNNPSVGICGGNLYKADLQPNSSYYDIDFLTLEYKTIFNRRRTIGFNQTQLPHEVNVIVGANLFINKKIFDLLGGFDKDFFMYFEEVELCNRVKKAGYKIVSLPDAKIIHLQGGAAENKNEELSNWSLQEHWYSKFIYFKKTKGNFHCTLLYFLYMLKSKLGFLAYTLKMDKEKKEYWILKKDLIKNTYQRYICYMQEKSKQEINNTDKVPFR